MNLHIPTFAILLGAALTMGQVEATDESQAVRQVVILDDKNTAPTIRSLLQYCEKTVGLQWVAAGQGTRILDKPFTPKTREVVVGDLLGEIADNENTSIVVTNDVAWLGDEKIYVGINNSDLSGVLSAVVDLYSVTVVARGGSQKKMSIEGEYYLREVMNAVLLHFNLRARYSGGAILLLPAVDAPGVKAQTVDPQIENNSFFPP
jgi:hypothetical protein